MNSANSRVSQVSAPATSDTSGGAFMLAAVLPLLVSVAAWCSSARQELPRTVGRPSLTAVWSALCACLVSPAGEACEALSRALVRWCQRASTGPYDTALAPLVGRAVWLAGELDALRAEGMQAPAPAEGRATVSARVRDEAITNDNPHLALQLLMVEEARDGAHDPMHRVWMLGMLAARLHGLASEPFDEVTEASGDNCLRKVKPRNLSVQSIAARRALHLSRLLVDVTEELVKATVAADRAAVVD